MAKQLGADRLLIIGGEVDGGSSRTLFSLLDLTIIGYYLFPTNSIKARCQAMGAVVDVATRKLLSTLDVSNDDWSLATSANRHLSEAILRDELRGEVLEQLAANLCQDFSKELPQAGEPKKLSVIGESSIGDPVENKTVYILSDGFHMALLVPEYDGDKIVSWNDIGSGDRNWVFDDQYRWLSATMAYVVHNSEAVLVRHVSPRRLKQHLKKYTHTWKVSLSPDDWGRVMRNLEDSVDSQEVIKAYGSWLTAVQSRTNYNLFSTCQHYAIEAFEGTSYDFGSNLPAPTPVWHMRIDKALAEK